MKSWVWPDSFFQRKLRCYCFEAYHLGPLFGALGLGWCSGSKNMLKWLNFRLFSEILKIEAYTGSQIGPQKARSYFIPSGIFRAITGIKNEVKSTIRSFYSFVGSAQTKILKKVLGHPIFWASIWIENDSKTVFFSHRQAWIATYLTEKTRKIIFFLWKTKYVFCNWTAILIWQTILFYTHM